MTRTRIVIPYFFVRITEVGQNDKYCTENGDVNIKAVLYLEYPRFVL